MITVGLLAAMTLPAHATDSTVQFQIPAPGLLPNHGGLANPDWPDCTPTQIQASARTVRSTYGVLGIVRLHGTHCLFAVSNRLVALLDANGHPLKLEVRDAKALDRGATPNALSGKVGAIEWGFAWRGPWCGADGVYVRARLSGGALLRIPLPGGKPGCTTSKVKPVVIRGTFGELNQPVQTAPLEWSSLKAHVAIDASLPGATLHGLSVSISNSSPTPVTLDPCPNYAVKISDTNGSAQVVGGELRDCPVTPTVIPGKGSITVNLPDAHFDREEFGSHPTKVTVTFGMAGLTPSAVQSRLA